jgi:hypothetical protein
VPESPPRRTILWHNAAQTGLLRRLARRSQLDVVAVGSPDATQSSALAKEWGSGGAETQPLNDLRAALATAQRGTLVLIADPGSFGSPAPASSDRASTRLDVEELDNAEERGVKIATFEPIPAALTQMAEAGVKVAAVAGGPDAVASPGTGGGGDWALLAPLSRFSRPVQELIEAMPTLGPLRALTIHSFGTAAHGSLGPRLFDAADLALLLMGPALPEGVHAVFTAPASAGANARGIHAAPPPPDHIRSLDGDLSASLRFDRNRAATITASNRAGSHTLAVTLLTDLATATIQADRLTIHHHGDGVIPVAPAARPDADPFIDALSTQLTRYLDSGVGLAGQVDFAATLALCQAALLSARTGEPESPATMLRLAGL